MDPTEVDNYIVHQLSKFQPEKEIVKGLCERWDFTWSQAEEYLKRTKLSQSSKIRGRQAPLLVTVGVGTVLLGIAGLIFSIYETLGGLVIFVAGIPWLGNFGWFVMSMAAILGGALGVWKAIE